MVTVLYCNCNRLIVNYQPKSSKIGLAGCMYCMDSCSVDSVDTFNKS